MDEKPDFKIRDRIAVRSPLNGESVDPKEFYLSSIRKPSIAARSGLMTLKYALFHYWDIT